MAIRRMIQLGNPLLRQVAQPFVAVPSDEAYALVSNLRDTLHDFRQRMGYGRALSAPIIGISRRAIVVELEGADLTLLNPVFQRWSREELIDYESCLTFPLWGKVSRSARVIVTALDLGGNQQTIEADGLLARVLQHEMDHLDGLVWLDRQPDLHSLCTHDEFKAQNRATS